MSDGLAHSYWEKFIAGDKEAFGEVYRIYKPRLTFYCLGKLKSIELAENCASEALIKTYKYQNPAEIKELENWLFTVARNLCVSALRKNQSNQTYLNNLSKVSNSSKQPEVNELFDAKDLNAIIAHELHDEELDIWKLHSEGYTNKEIAEQLRINEKTVANKKSEIRRRLKEVLKNRIKPGNKTG